MKIIRKTDRNTCRFDQVDVGDIFSDGKAIYMKMQNAASCNSVNLDNGEIAVFKNEEKVKVVDATLTVEPF